MHPVSALTGTLIYLLYMVLDFYFYVVIISAILSWLVAFNLINTRNHFVQMVGDFLYRITEPALRPIRKVLPPVNGLDLSPLVLLFIISALQYFLRHLATG